MSRGVQRSPASRKRRMLLAAGSAGVLLALVFALAVLYVRPLLAGPALTELVITGNLQHVSPQAVRAAVRAQIGSGFFTTNADAVRDAVAALPWVAAVSVRRGWPHTLYIDIDEEAPVARWNGTGLVDAAGHVFTDSGGQAWTQLPQLSGPDGSAATVLNEYHTFGALLAPQHLAIRQMDVDARGAATLALSDGISVRLGRQQAEVRLERFAGVALQVLANQLPQVAYVDMRYTNGFAVGYMPTCQWQAGADGKRRGRDAAAGQPARDGSQGCAPSCVAAGRPAMDGSESCASACGAAGLRTMDGSTNCGTPCASAIANASQESRAGQASMDGSQSCASSCAAAGQPAEDGARKDAAASQPAKDESPGVCTTTTEVQAHGQKN